MRNFLYRPDGKRTGSIEEVSPHESLAYDGENAVSVIGFATPGDLPRARRLLSGPAQKRMRMIAVASPAVFNRPDFREVLTRDQLEVIVGEPSRFDPEQLPPWIAKLLEDTPAPAPVRAPADTGLRDGETGRLDARKIAELLDISMTDLAVKVCGISKQALSQRPAGAAVQAKLQPLEGVAEALAWCGGDKAAFRAWLNRPNRDFPLMDGKTPSPLDLILRGHAAIVAAKAGDLRTGHPA